MRNNCPVITRLVIVDLLAHGFDELVGIWFLKSLGICEYLIAQHIKSNQAEGISNNRVPGIIIEIINFMNARYHAISIDCIRADCVGGRCYFDITDQQEESA